MTILAALLPLLITIGNEFVKAGGLQFLFGKLLSNLNQTPLQSAASNLDNDVANHDLASLGKINQDILSANEKPQISSTELNNMMNLLNTAGGKS